MTNKPKLHNCRVCGQYHEDPPWGDDGNTPIYEFCDCCGVEFGHEDVNKESILDFLETWKRGDAIMATMTYEDYLAKKEQEAKDRAKGR